MDIPQAAIVGRPNVGKSTLFNCLLKKRVAIVERFSGVTRDRISSLLHVGQRSVELTDTGGMFAGRRTAASSIAGKVQSQIETAVDEANLLLFVVDVSEGLVPLDEEAAAFIRKSNKPVILVANKADNKRSRQAAAAFHKLGLGEPFAMSAKNNLGRGELLEMIEKHLKKIAPAQPGETPEMRVAVVGKRNVGKSTLVNALAGVQRVIVDPVPGTTRDSVDVPLRAGTKFMVAVDTAGMRKKRRLDDSVEFFSRVRTEAAIRTASVVLLLLDAGAAISRVDKKLASYIIEHARPCVIVVNKWDLAGDIPTGEFGDYVRKKLTNLHYAPIVFTSALNSTNVSAALSVAGQLHEQGSYRAGTGMLNRMIQDAVARRSPGRRGGKRGPRPKILYATQAQVRPPTVVLFVNNPKLFTKRYLRYIENYLRSHLPFSEIPIRIKLKPRG